MAEILRLHLGSVIPFEQDAYRHIDLMVNNAVIGIGQAVKVGENFGLKITEMGPMADRIRSLGPDSVALPGIGRTEGPSA
jgi:flagellar motor switch protein FliN/FliY